MYHDMGNSRAKMEPGGRRARQTDMSGIPHQLATQASLGNNLKKERQVGWAFRVS